MLDLASGGPDRVWAATAAGLCRIEIHEIRRAPLPGVPRLLAPAPHGGVYALYATEIVQVGESVERRIPLPIDPARAQATALASLSDGTLRLSIDGRGYQRRPGGEWTDCEPPAGPRASLEHHGEVWKATRGRGILRRRKRPYFRRVPIPGASRVHALALAPDGAIWCGTDRGVAKVKDGRVTRIGALDGKELGTVTACAVDDEGRVWIGSGSSFPGVYRLDADGSRRLQGIDGYVHRITKDPSGALWFAVLNRPGGGDEEGGGAWYFADGAFHAAPANVELPSARVYDVIARDRSGVLWFATLKGLAAYEGPDRVTHYTPESIGLKGEKVWCLCAARDGSLWIGYQNARGVSRLAQGVLRHFDADDGLCDGNVWSIVEGREGVFWFANRSGLSRYDGRRWSCFRNEEGLGSEPIWPLLPLPDGSLWIGTVGAGLVHFVPGDDAPPRTRFRADRFEASEGEPVEVSWRGTDAWYDTPARELSYRWRLDGGRWSAAGAVTSVTVTPPPGGHTFSVQAIDRFGNAEDPPATVAIEVSTPPAPLPWSLLAAGAAAAVAAGYFIGRRGRRRDS